MAKKSQGSPEPYTVQWRLCVEGPSQRRNGFKELGLMNADSSLPKPLLEVRDLRVEFRVSGSAAAGDGSKEARPRGGGVWALRALDGVDISLYEGEILGLVGESGSGKTVFTLALLRLIQQPGRIAAGQIIWQGRDLLPLDEREMRKIRGREMAIIFQNPQLSLNPVRTAGSQLTAVLRLHHGISSHQASEQAVHWLREVGVPDPERVLGAYPHELSGGLCQRMMIAMALSCRPKLLIADEPTAALDVTIQAQIMDLLLELRQRYGMAILLVSHDLGLIARLCDRIAVLYLGRIVEVAAATELYDSPLHPYTQALLRAVPVPDPHHREKLQVLEGEPPNQLRLPRGSCRFLGRCPVAVDRCRSTDPPLTTVNSTAHQVACVHYAEAGYPSPAGMKDGEKQEGESIPPSVRRAL